MRINAAARLAEMAAANPDALDPDSLVKAVHAVKQIAKMGKYITVEADKHGTVSLTFDPKNLPVKDARLVDAPSLFQPTMDVLMRNGIHLIFAAANIFKTGKCVFEYTYNP